MKNEFNMMNKKEMGKKAQLTIFIILAIVIVAGIALYFIFRGQIFKQNIPAELDPVYSYYLSCIQSETETGASLLGQSGGYIQYPEFEAGSEYMPFSSQLGFMGNGIPYWYYLSGNGIAKEQIPSIAKMQTQLNDYVSSQINICDFSEFEDRGFNITIGPSVVSSVINDGSVSINVEQDLSISLGELIWSSNSHEVEVSSNLGKFYNLASEIYKNQKTSMFLERYGVDVLRLYAPVDGSEIGCAPKVWSVDKVREDLKDALEVNVPAIKIKGDYYELSKKENSYFVQDLGQSSDVSINFMYSRDWPMKMEVWPSEDNILTAQPIGLQEGLGMLGFCYTPYHFVYDLGYPVLVQLYSGSEIFQFPVVVLINKNNPREALDVEGLPEVVPELCSYKNTPLEVSTYNVNLEAVEADIKFKCFDTTCTIGKTKMEGSDAVLKDNFPQCVNGYIIASAEGYETKKYLTSSVQSGNVVIILDKKYNLTLDIQKNSNELSNGYAVITFTKDNQVKTFAYPEQKEIQLTAGQYAIKAYIYSNSTISLKGSSSQKCTKVPRSGISGIFGLTEEKCFTVTIPDQIASLAISGGGNENYFIGESELESSKKLIINANDFGIPEKVEDLQTNYDSVETNSLEVLFE